MIKKWRAQNLRILKVINLIMCFGFIFFFQRMTFAAGPHSHGSAKLSIVMEKNKGTIEFSVDSGAIYGFEHMALKPADQKRRDDGVNRLRTNISKIIDFDPSLKCILTESKIDAFVSENDHKSKSVNAKRQATHGELKAEYNFVCEKSPQGSKLNLAFGKIFPSIHDLDVQIIGEERQSKQEVEGKEGKVQL